MTFKEIKERIEELDAHILILRMEVNNHKSAHENAAYVSALNDAIRQLERRKSEYENARWVMAIKEGS